MIQSSIPRFVIPLLFVLQCVTALATDSPQPPISAFNRWLPFRAKPAVNTPATTDDVVPTTFSAEQDKFALSLLDRWCTSGKNLVFCPPSIWWLQAMAANGASGEDQAHFVAPLGYTPGQQAEVNQYCKAILAHYRSTPDINAAISAWFSRDHKINKPFRSTAEKTYGAEVASLNMRSPKAMTQMNEWASKATRGKVTRIVNHLDPDAAATFISAAYLKARWRSPFYEPATKQTPFHGAVSTVSVPMMNRNIYVRYAWEKDWEGVALPYKTEGLEMVIVLPTKNGSIATLATAFTGMTWKKVSGAFKPRYGSVSIPRFTIDYRNEELATDLRNMAGGAPFILNDVCVQDQEVDSCIHQAAVEVDEKGTVAAAATAMALVPVCAPPPLQFEFTADRPFLFFIVDGKTELILFAGAYVQPE